MSNWFKIITFSLYVGYYLVLLAGISNKLWVIVVIFQGGILIMFCCLAWTLRLNASDWSWGVSLGAFWHSLWLLLMRIYLAIWIDFVVTEHSMTFTVLGLPVAVFWTTFFLKLTPLSNYGLAILHAEKSCHILLQCLQYCGTLSNSAAYQKSGI